MSQPDFERAGQSALDRLARELPSQVTYHSLAHTLEEVFPAAKQFAALEGVTGEDLLLLRTAALYHDIGYVEQHAHHEESSVRIASAMLPDFGYGPAQISIVVDAILATRLPQQPHSLLERILADADLSVLGDKNYLPRSAELRAELAAFGQAMTDMDWYSSQLEFIRDHRYFTPAARALRDAQKHINVAAMAALLVQCR